MSKPAGDLLSRAVETVASYHRPGGTRHCKLCGDKIRSGQAAVRVADIKDTANPVGRLRYWLCRNCADKIGDAIQAAS